MNQLLRKPSAWVPIVASVGMLAFLLTYLALFGVHEPQEDEGTPAHVFQLWVVFEFFTISVFAVRWLSQMPKAAFRILALQILAALVPFVIVFLLESQ